MSEPLPEEFQAALRANAAARGPFGSQVVFFSETASTNDVAAGMAERGAPEGAMVLALAQTAGRGRLGRTWFSPAGAGLYVSVICRDPRVAPMLTLTGGVAVAEAIRRTTGLPVVLKWPNDVLVAEGTRIGRGRKLAGILAEGSSGPDGLQFVVLGFGINLRPAKYPAALAPYVTSIETELGRAVEAAPLLADVLALLHHYAATIVEGRTPAVLQRWRELAPWAVGAGVEWTVSGVRHRGTTAGIDDRGALLVRVSERVERIVAGEVTWL